MGFDKSSVTTAPGIGVGDGENGLSITNPAPFDFRVVLGQDVGQAGDPAILLNNREIPTDGFDLSFTGNGNLLTDGNIGIDQPAPAANIHIGNAGVLAHILMQATNNIIDMQGNAAQILFTANAGTIRTSQLNMEISQPSSMGAVGSYHWIRFNNPNHMQISGDGIGLLSLQEFRTPNGTATFTSFQLSDVFEQLGGANGITRSIFISPTLIAVVDYRALEIANNAGFAIYQSGSLAENFFNGQSGFGTSTPSARVHSAAQTNLAGTAPIKLGLSATLMGAPEPGAIEGTLEYPTFTTTTGAARRPFMLLSGAFTADRVPFVNTAADGFATSNNLRYNDTSTSLGVGAAPSSNAFVVLGAGTTTRAPMRYNAGPVQTPTLVNGSKEFDGTNEFLTAGGVRYTLAKTLTNTAVLDFPSTAPGTISDLTIALTGAADGDVVSLGVPIAAQTATGSYVAFVSAAGVVTVRFTVPGATVGPEDPGSGTFRVSVTKY